MDIKKQAIFGKGSAQLGGIVAILLFLWNQTSGDRGR
jgi:hypothetical protein